MRDCHLCHHEEPRVVCSFCDPDTCEGCQTMQKLETVLKLGKFNSNHFIRRTFPSMPPGMRAKLARGIDVARGTERS